jgi:nucleoside-diphosphate-sugar epimerase
LYVDDFLRIATKLLREDAFPDPTIVASKNNVTLGEIAEQIKKLTSSDVSIVYDTRGSNEHRTFDTTRLKDLIGDIEETSLDVGLQKTIDDIRQRTRKNV